ncbi:MAG: alkaline phosphatase family protein [Candidatus Omnitrophota bacterium]
MIFVYIDPGSGFTVAGGLGGAVAAALLPLLVVFGVFFKRIFRFFSRHKKTSFLLLFVLLSVTAVIVGALMVKDRSKFNKKIIILGMDGLSPVIVNRLMAEGKLPNFARLKESGSFSELATTNPSQSPVAWSGFATGKNPGKHGVSDFIRRDPKNYGLELSTTRISGGKVFSPKKGDSFWHYTSEMEIPTVIIGCPVTFPPEKLNGRMLSGMGTPDILGTQGTFSFYTTEPLRNNKDTGGKVFQAPGGKMKLLTLLGPKKAQGASGKVDNLAIPFKVTVAEAEDAITIDMQGKRIELKKGRWSDWVDVAFKAGFFTKISGILKFHLVETKPEFKLYASPVNLDPRKPYFPITYPENYAKELAGALGLFYTQGMPYDTWAVNEKRLSEGPFLEQISEVLRERKAVLELELERMKSGILFCYFGTSDIVQHMFWRYIDKDHPLYDEEGAKIYKNVIDGWYQKMDSILGEVAGKIGDKDILIVLSDHGFDTFRRSVHVNSWLRKNGYLYLKDPQAVSGSELLFDVDWARTKAYAIGFGSIYINQIGREGKGIIKPGEETEALKRELSEKLLAWKDTENDTPVLNSVYRKEEIFRGPYSDSMADLYLGFNIGYRASWQTALGAAPEKEIENNLKKWSGSHLFDPKLIPGVIFINKAIIKNDPSLYDLTPTILKESGMPEDKIREYEFDGAPLY